MAKDNNWSRKTELQKKAVEHTLLVDRLYGDSIKNCETITFDDFAVKLYKEKAFATNKSISNVNCTNRKIIVTATDSVSAICDHYSSGKIAVINFASYKEPGGMFLNGSMAQEEALCHKSFLYNVLRVQTDYYDWNRQHLNNALYLNRALYSKDVMFFRDNHDFASDVITCAAPNFTTAKRYCGINREANDRVLLDRIRFVIDIAVAMGVDTLIAGAWGCGVFGQDPETVAKAFDTVLSETTGLAAVIFAIPGNGNGNLEAFQKVFK